MIHSSTLYASDMKYKYMKNTYVVMLSLSGFLVCESKSNYTIFSSISWHIFQLLNNGAHINCVIIFRPGRFPRIAGNSRNHGKDQKFHKSDQIFNQTKRNINKFCLGKISLQKTLRIKFSVDSGFSNELYGKNKKHGNHGNQQKAF